MRPAWERTGATRSAAGRAWARGAGLEQKGKPTSSGGEALESCLCDEPSQLSRRRFAQVWRWLLTCKLWRPARSTCTRVSTAPCLHGGGVNVYRKPVVALIGGGPQNLLSGLGISTRQYRPVAACRPSRAFHRGRVKGPQAFCAITISPVPAATYPRPSGHLPPRTNLASALHGISTTPRRRATRLSAGRNHKPRRHKKMVKPRKNKSPPKKVAKKKHARGRSAREAARDADWHAHVLKQSAFIGRRVVKGPRGNRPLVGPDSKFAKISLRCSETRPPHALKKMRLDVLLPRRSRASSTRPRRAAS